MPYTITARDKRRMSNIFVQLFRFMALSRRFMVLTSMGGELPPRPRDAQPRQPQGTGAPKTT
jgi:hypothetical protein